MKMGIKWDLTWNILVIKVNHSFFFLLIELETPQEAATLNLLLYHGVTF